MGLSNTTKTRILLRSLLIQGAWNFKGMQNIGFLYAIAPGLRAIHNSAADEAIARHQAFFNTQPYMAPTVMGITLHLEEHEQSQLIPKVLPSVSGSLAAVGDTFFWATLKPITALLCLLAVICGMPWSIITVLVLFNLGHLWIMIWGFLQGYRHGPAGALKVGSVIAIDTTHRVSYAIPFLCGGILAFIPSWTGHADMTSWFLLAFLAIVLIGRLRVPSWIIFYGLFICILVWTIMT